MGSVNVNRNVTDPYYRYKMPRINAKVEGKGNGIKTVIVNMAEVAKAIGRPATYPTKYFGCELGAQTQFDYKNERFIVNGSHDASKLQDLLDGFIRKFVLCPECDNPETNLLVSTKKGTISQKCKACGFHGLLLVTHKVNTFILKNPPNMDPAAQGSSLTEGKRSKRSKKSGAENSADSSNNISTNIAVNAADASQTAAEIDMAIPVTVNDEDDDVNWTVDISEEAVRARLQDLTEGAKCITISDQADKSEKERLDIFYELVKKKRDAGQLTTDQVCKELVTEANQLDISLKAPLVLAELLFTDNILEEMSKNRKLLLYFTYDKPKAQRHFIGGIEQIIELHSAKLMDKVVKILKSFYDLDILDEKVIIGWSQRISKKYVPIEIATTIHEKAKPFVEWLQVAQEEESSEDNEDDENSDHNVKIEYNDRARGNHLKEDTSVNKSAAKIPEDEDDDGEDIDIDDI